MIWIDLLVIFVLALAFSTILTWGFGWRHPARQEGAGTAILFLFLILLFAMWAGRPWLPPGGWVIHDTPWLGLLIIGLFVSLLLLAAAEPRRMPRTPAEARATAEAEEVMAATVFGVFFWLLLLGLVVAVVLSYVL